MSPSQRQHNQTAVALQMPIMDQPHHEKSRLMECCAKGIPPVWLLQEVLMQLRTGAAGHSKGDGGTAKTFTPGGGPP